MKKYLKFTIIISLLFLFISNTMPYSEAKETKENNLLSMQKEKFKDKNIEIQEMSQKEIQFLQTLQEKNKDIKNIKAQMQKENYKEIKLENINSKLKYTTKDGKGYGFIVNSAYKNEKTKNIVVTETIYDSYNKKITKFVAEKKSSTKNQEGKLLANKDYVEKTPDKNTKILKAGFKWNGKSFSCSMAGLYACAHYCGVWAIVNPIAGGACQAVCGTAFAAACSVG